MFRVRRIDLTLLCVLITLHACSVFSWSQERATSTAASARIAELAPAIRDPLRRTESTRNVGQKAIDPFAILPATDALLVLDLKRFTSDVLPRLLVGEPDARALVIAFPDPKTIELLDPRSVQHVLAAFRYTTPQDEKTPID